MAVAVICEFNPFHNGHKYLIDEARRRTGQGVLAVMSGSFTQRGEAALQSKFDRALDALNHGVDLAVELPSAYAVANAQRFAQGGVSMAASFDCVEYLAFGCETDDLNLLRAAADAAENPRVLERLREGMNSGGYYPRELEAAVRETLGSDVARVLKSPNNILAAEYLRAIKGSKIKPLPIKRVGAEHDSTTESGGFASASLIRQLVRSGQPSSSYMPGEIKAFTRPENLERAMLYKLRTMSIEEFSVLPEVSEGLENRLFRAVRGCGSTEEIIAAVKTKRYTHARLRRILICALLGITRDLQQTQASYARVLGFTPRGAQMLRSCSFEVVTSVADALKNESVNSPFLRADVRACDILGIAFDSVEACSADFHTKMIKTFSEK